MLAADTAPSLEADGRLWCLEEGADHASVENKHHALP
jgi:hypothetical protein